MEIATNDVFPLLKLPAGVETLLLPFVASGSGGLQSLLNLRQVCSTTKSWVDTLPPRQGKPLLSRAQVRMDTQVRTLKRFLKSAPPFPVSTLSVNIKAILDKNPPAEEEELWTEFCNFWTPRLETLELRKEPGSNIHHIFSYRKIVCLVESPNLKVLRLNSFCVPWNKAAPIPSSLYKFHELSINFTGPHEEHGEMEMKHFYSELKKNPNLRKLEASVYNVAEYECLQNLIDAKKEDARLELNLHLNDAFPEDEWDDDDVEDEDGVKYLEFAKSVVTSKSTIRLQMSDYFSLENAVAFLPRHVVLEMFEKVESVSDWEPSEDTLSLLESLPRLKQVRVETGRDDVNFERLTFPPSLEDLTFTSGFPARAALPEALRSLTLQNFSCNPTEFVNSLNLLKAQCAGLETLRITWKCEGSEAPAVEVDKSPRFPKLRSLSLDCGLFRGDVESCRAVLRGFQVETLQLNHLALRFWRRRLDSRLRDYLPVVDAPFLTRLCEGPVGNSLVMVDIQKEFVTPDGLPMLEKLTSLAAGNAKSREEREGRGPWQRQWSN